MRIAMSIHALFGGGAERVMSQLASRWAMAGHEVHLITWAAASTDRYDLPPSVNRHGLDLMQPSRNRWQGLLANLHRLQELRATLRNIQPEWILSFCDQMNISTLQAAKKMEIPIWIAERSDPEKQRLSPIWEFCRRHTYPNCTGCIVQTPSIADYLSRWIPREQIIVLPNAIEIPPIGNARERGSSQRPLVILALGRLGREKGMDLLIAAWRQIESQLSDWQLRIAGDGAQRATLEQLSDDLKPIQFLGWIENPWPCYRDASLFILPSRYEGFPNVLVEAMSQGVACIATRCTEAVAELSRGGKAVYLVDTESADQLAAAIVQLAQDPARRIELGEAAKLVAAQYSWSRLGPQWDRLLP